MSPQLAFWLVSVVSPAIICCANRTAAREYNKGVQDFEKTGQVDKKAREAADALSGPDANDMKKAEEVGKSHSHGEDPAVKR